MEALYLKLALAVSRVAIAMAKDYVHEMGSTFAGSMDNDLLSLLEEAGEDEEGLDALEARMLAIKEVNPYAGYTDEVLEVVEAIRRLS